MRQFTITLLSLLLVACTAGTGYQYPTGYPALPVLSTVTLNREFNIQPHRASEYIQYGVITPYNQIVEYYPYCQFELRTVKGTSRTVTPETFIVTGIHRDQFMAGFRWQRVADSGGGDYNMIMSTTVISLHADRQADVFRLSCMQLDEPYLARHVSLDQMRETLGDLFTLE
ncbi:MAG: hypothetical protein WBO34_09425 [Gammaproteobacteria bacterium]